MQAVVELLALPFILVASTVSSNRLAELEAQGYQLESRGPVHDAGEEASYLVDNAVTLYRGEERRWVTNEGRSLNEKTRELLNRAMKNPYVCDPITHLIYAATALSWAHFEMLGREVWTSALNLTPRTRARTALESSEKTISIKELADYGWDVRSSLGDLLSRRFDFTGVKGMRKAYRAAFPNEADLLTAFDDPLVERLEKTRHLIAHRAGVVDEVFRRQTGCSQSAGSSLHISVRECSKLANAATIAGDQIITIVDRLVSIDVQGTHQEMRNEQAG